MSGGEHDVLGALVEAERRTVAQPSEAQARAGWARLQRALPGAAVVPQIDVPPASVEAVGELGGLGKLWMLGRAGWVGKTVVAAVAAATIGTVGVIATHEDVRRDPPLELAGRVADPQDVGARELPSPALPPATLPPVEPPISAQPSALAPIEPSVQPRVQARAVESRSSATRKPVGATPTPVRPSAIDSERALIDAAQSALREGAADRALALLGEHASRYPRGGMLEDREALRVVVLCRLGRKSESARAREKFLQRWPDSFHGARVRASCSDEPSAK